MADQDPAVKAVMEAFSALKEANDEKLNKQDALLDEKLAKINKTLDQFEPMNQKLTLAEQTAKAMQEQLDRVEAALNRPDKGGDGKQDKDAAEYRAAFERCLRRAPDNREPADVSLINKRRNTLVKGDDAGAGYLMAPPEVQREIIKDIIEMSPMRALATVRLIGGDSLKQPRRTAAAGAATRVGEVQPRTNTGDPAYGMLQIHAPEMFARAEISQQMLEDSDYDLVAELRGEFAEQFAVKEGTEFISGTGASNQAEGLLTPSGVGEVVSGVATAITGDGLINLQGSLKTGYARNALFILNRATLTAIRVLKDGEGRYIWVPGIAQAVPNSILGESYVEMPDMPDIGAGTYPVAYGDFKRAYVVVDRIGISFQPDYTTGADNGVVVFRSRTRVGGGVRQKDAYKKLKIAAS